VPTEMDSVNVDIKGLTEMKPTLSFPLTAGNDSSKSKLPLQISLVPANEQDFGVRYHSDWDCSQGNAGSSRKRPVSSCICRGQRLLAARLFSLGAPVHGRPPCDRRGSPVRQGIARMSRVAPSSLPVYTPGQLLPAPDASANPLVDSGLGDSGPVEALRLAPWTSAQKNPSLTARRTSLWMCLLPRLTAAVGDGAGDTGTGGDQRQWRCRGAGRP